MSEHERILINLRDLVGEDCGLFADGQRIFANILPGIERRDRIVFDFEGIEVVASPFLNAAVGQIFKHMQRPDFERCIEFVHTNEDINETLQRVISNSERFYQDPNQRTVVSKLALGER